MNVGIRYALKLRNGANYILLLNSDTVVDKNFLEPLIKTIQNDERVGIEKYRGRFSVSA